jgi:hypothetical protein
MVGPIRFRPDCELAAFVGLESARLAFVVEGVSEAEAVAEAEADTSVDREKVPEKVYDIIMKL